MTALPTTAYKVLTAEQMATLERDASFAGAPVDLADGYMHLSTAEQLTETVDRHFAGQIDLHVAAIDLGSFGAGLKWEKSRGGQLFPHLYGGPLLLETVIAYDRSSARRRGRSSCRSRDSAKHINRRPPRPAPPPRATACGGNAAGHAHSRAMRSATPPPRRASAPPALALQAARAGRHRPPRA